MPMGKRSTAEREGRSVLSPSRKKDKAKEGDGVKA